MPESEAQNPPGPTPIPKCVGCGRRWDVIAMKEGHAPGCEIDAENKRNVAASDRVMAALSAAVAERRQDTEFMERLAGRLEGDKHILDHLAYWTR